MLNKKAPTDKSDEKLFEMDAGPSDESNEWLDTVEAARYLRVGVPSLRNMTSNGQIPHYKLGRRNRYRLSDLRNLLLNNRRGGLNGNKI